MAGRSTLPTENPCAVWAMVLVMAVTAPEEGTAHEPSPRQKVVELADVPLFKRFTDKFPLVILLALVVSVVADVAKATPLVFVQVDANVPEVVQSPLMSPFVIEVAPENFVRFPEAGDPVVVTLPEEEADITPPDMVMVEPSGFTHPSCDVVALLQDNAPDEIPRVAPSGRDMPFAERVATGNCPEEAVPDKSENAGCVADTTPEVDIEFIH